MKTCPFSKEPCHIDCALYTPKGCALLVLALVALKLVKL